MQKFYVKTIDKDLNSILNENGNVHEKIEEIWVEAE